MISALITLLILVVIVGIVAWLCTYLVDMLPIEGPFKQVAKVLIIVIAILIILLKALPLLNVSIGSL